MGLVSKLLGDQDTEKSDTAQNPSAAVLALADGALDTLSSVIQVMGLQSFPLEDDYDSSAFPETCLAFACHVENGAAVPSFDIPPSSDGVRDWASVRRFFADRRHAEKAFVTDRLQGYRGIVDDLVSGLREIGVRDKNTESSILRCLEAVEDAVGTGTLPQIKAALSQTLEDVTATFAEQREAYESHLEELNERMSSMRQDLVAAREEMQRDALTEAYNRGAFDTAIAHSVNAFFILRQPLTVLMIDLDDFKHINDTWGHAAGDEVLRAVSDCLARSFIRKNDFVARFGGDEFAGILPDTSAAHTVKIIERLLTQVRAIAVPFGDASLQIRCSIGYTEISANDSAEDLLKRADEALYMAKSNGRDQCICLTAPTAESSAEH
jgi:diguanylate cyclase (GGDEF)-like protein